MNVKKKASPLHSSASLLQPKFILRASHNSEDPPFFGISSASGFIHFSKLKIIPLQNYHHLILLCTILLACAKFPFLFIRQTITDPIHFYSDACHIQLCHHSSLPIVPKIGKPKLARYYI